jgi:putative membrane protein
MSLSTVDGAALGRPRGMCEAGRVVSTVPVGAFVTSLGAPPAPTAWSLFLDWRLDPLAAAFVAVAAWAYLAGVRRVRRDGGHWSRGYTLTFLVAGLGGLAWTSMGWAAVYGEALFSVYAVQLVTLLMVVPFLLALGRPLALAQQALGPRGRDRLAAVLDSRPARLFTVPVVSPLLLAVIPFVVFFTGLFPASLTEPGLRWPLHLALVLIGLGVMVPIWESEAVAARIAYPIALLFAFIELLADAVPGIVIRLETHIFALSYFTSLARPWGSGLLDDQQLGGDLLWCIGEAVDLPFLVLLLVAWIRSDAREAARVDRALDALTPAAPSAPAAASGGVMPAEPTGTTRPWWELDASVFGDRADQFRRSD